MYPGPWSNFVAWMPQACICIVLHTYILSHSISYQGFVRTLYITRLRRSSTSHGGFGAHNHHRSHSLIPSYTAIIYTDYHAYAHRRPSRETRDRMGLGLGYRHEGESKQVTAHDYHCRQAFHHVWAPRRRPQTRDESSNECPAFEFPQERQPGSAEHYRVASPEPLEL
jgi:hypothetical protein